MASLNPCGEGPHCPGGVPRLLRLVCLVGQGEGNNWHIGCERRCHVDNLRVLKGDERWLVMDSVVAGTG